MLRTCEQFNLVSFSFFLPPSRDLSQPLDASNIVFSVRDGIIYSFSPSSSSCSPSNRRLPRFKFKSLNYLSLSSSIWHPSSSPTPSPTSSPITPPTSSPMSATCVSGSGTGSWKSSGVLYSLALSLVRSFYGLMSNGFGTLAFAVSSLTNALPLQWRTCLM